MKTETFGEYAEWYDSFNRDKDFAGEVGYIVERARQHTPALHSWLDLGCGTGRHLAHLAARGLRVEGADQSEAMIQRARARLPQVPLHISPIQSLHLGKKFDAVSMLFHVINYQTSDAMVQGALETAAGHVAGNGVVIFDFWHTPGVRNDPPASRIRRIEVADRPLFRISQPMEDRAHQRIDVKFEFRWDTPSGPLAHEEIHSMRHFTVEDLEAFAGKAGLRLVRCEKWMDGGALTSHDWYGLACARPVKRVPA